MQELTRRTVLRLGAGLAGACALDPIWQLGLATASGAPPDQPSPSSAKALPTYVTGSFVSAARGGVETRVGDRPAARPMRAVATGDRAARSRHDGVDGVMGMGVEAGLAQLAKAGYPPFAVVAVDGGNGWWHRRVTGEDSGAMVLNELLADAGDQGPRHVAGRASSAGRWAATARLLLGGALGPGGPPRSARSRPRCSPTTAWRSRRAHSTDPRTGSRTRCTARPRSPRSRLRIDCGAEDRFYHATKQFVASLRRPPVGGVLRSVVTTSRRGARSCPENWPGWRRSALIPGYAWVP